jgi:hypothetical protein
LLLYPAALDADKDEGGKADNRKKSEKAAAHRRLSSGTNFHISSPATKIPITYNHMPIMVMLLSLE